MKLFTRLSFCLAMAVFLVVTTSETSAQTQYPPISQKAMMMQRIGDTDVMITYHRPNVKGRKLWGSEAEKALVPNGKVWRTGANAATVFEVTNDVMINGKKLPKGKYSFCFWNWLLKSFPSLHENIWFPWSTWQGLSCGEWDQMASSRSKRFRHYR